MTNRKIETNEAFLNRMKKKCVVFYVAFRILFIVSAVVWVGWAGMILIGFISPESVPGLAQQSLLALISFIFFGLCFILVLRMIILILKDVSQGITPFSTVQVKRIKLIALLLLLYGISDSIISFIMAGVTTLIENSGFVSGIVVSGGSNESFVLIPIGVFIAAILTYCLSIVLEYGIKLQEQSDEIL
jgi:hypothetical protein